MAEPNPAEKLEQLRRYNKWIDTKNAKAGNRMRFITGRLHLVKQQPLVSNDRAEEAVELAKLRDEVLKIVKKGS